MGDEIFQNLTDAQGASEVKAEVEAAKRRSPFRLSMIGIAPGTELQLAKDPAIICTTVDESNKVNYLGSGDQPRDEFLRGLNMTCSCGASSIRKLTPTTA